MDDIFGIFEDMKDSREVATCCFVRNQVVVSPGPSALQRLLKARKRRGREIHHGKVVHVGAVVTNVCCSVGQAIPGNRKNVLCAYQPDETIATAIGQRCFTISPLKCGVIYVDRRTMPVSENQLFVTPMLCLESHNLITYAVIHK